MTPDERQLLEDFFSRVAATDVGVKDRAADAFIAQELKRNPDAAYLIVQTALVYEQHNTELEQRVRDLEQEVEDANAGTQTSFLGGRLGQARAPQPSGAGYARVRQEVLDEQQATGRASPWSRGPEPAPRAAPPAQPAPQQGGGFLRSAMATAAGVAGGLMLGDGLRGLFGGGEAHASGSDRSAADQAALADADRTQDELQDELAERDAQDDAAQDADFGSDDGSFDV